MPDHLPSRADGDSALRPELERFAADWAAAIVANDADLIGTFMTDDWTMVSEDGVSTREHFLAVVRSGRLAHSAMERVSPLLIRRCGDVVVLTARVTNTAHVAGARYDADEWTTDIVLRDGGRWRCVHTQITAARDAESG